MVTTVFGSDRALLYNVKPWNELGFAVPNFGNNFGTISTPIWNLADELGKVQLMVMTHIDAQRTQAPSRNTIERIGKMCNRVQSVLSGRQRQPNELLIEEQHATAELRPWLIHPVPYFESAIVRNHWLSEYNMLVTIALTNIYQHSDNNLALTVTEAFAQQMYQYFGEIKRLMGMELLGIDEETVVADGFKFTKEHYDAYDPSSVTLNFEQIDTPGPVASRITEDALQPLFRGIPANLIVSNLKQYPIGNDGYGISGQALPEEAAIDTKATAAAGGSIGKPAV